MKAVCPFKVEDFFVNNKNLVKKYLRKNTYSIEVPDWNDVPDDWYYKGQEGVLRSGIKNKPYTTLQKLEWIKCALDVKYFTRRHIKIVSLDDGVIPFRLYDYQEDLLDQYQSNRFILAMQARQTGKTQTTAAYILWFIQFHSAKNAAILANKGDQAQEILERIQMSFESLPMYMQQGVRTYNKRSMTLETKSKAFSAASSSSSIRGKSIALLYIDEAAFIRDDMAFYESTYPTVASGKESQVIVTSTPNGTRGLFYKLWCESEAQINRFVRTLVTWDMVPGRDDAWKEETIGNTSEEQFRQEHECHFRGSQNSLLSGMTLEKMVTKRPVSDSEGMRVYKEPVKGHHYFAACDVSHGVGGDYHAMSIVDVTTRPFEVVATYRNNTLDPLMYPTLIFNAAMHYNSASVLVEINDIGEQVANALYYDLEYENLLMVTQERGRQVLGFGGNPRVGLRHSKSTKAIGCSNVKTMIEKEQLIVWDSDAISEFGTFVPRNGSYAADSGAHDDMVMTLVTFAWATTQSYFIDLTDRDLRAQLLKQAEARNMEEVSPFGFIENDFGSFDGEVVAPAATGLFEGF